MSQPNLTDSAPAVNPELSPTEELWRPVGATSLYDVSSLGRVRTWRKRGRRKVPGVIRLPSPRILRLRTHKSGYEVVTLAYPSGKRTRKVHHLVLEAFAGPRPVGMEAAHIDGNERNNRAANLCWCTHRENEAHKSIYGVRTFPRTRVFTGEQLHKAAETLDATGSIRAASKAIGVSRSVVQRLRDQGVLNTK